MLDSAERKANAKAEREAREKAARRAEQASVIEGLQKAIEGDEHLLAFARGRIAGGWRGKLNVGPEAFFAPYVNIGLTERRVILQHIHPETGRPSEILPHSFPIAEIADLTCTDIETFGGERACRIVLRFHNDQHFRLRLAGTENTANAEAMEEVFRSLTAARHKEGVTPTQSICPACSHILDTVTKFCPYCGQHLAETTPPVSEAAPAATKTSTTATTEPNAAAPAPASTAPETAAPTPPIPPEMPTPASPEGLVPPTPPMPAEPPLSAATATETSAAPVDQAAPAAPPAENAADTAPSATAQTDTATTEFHVAESFAPEEEPLSPELPVAPTEPGAPIARYTAPAAPPVETDTVAEAWTEAPPEQKADSDHPETRGENS